MIQYNYLYMYGIILYIVWKLYIYLVNLVSYRRMIEFKCDDLFGFRDSIILFQWELVDVVF